VLIVLLIIVALSIAAGGFGQPRFGYWGWSPLGLVFLVLILLWLTGHLHGCHVLRY
jgi:hypothetical protein